jgi:hypothetical protein
MGGFAGTDEPRSGCFLALCVLRRSARAFCSFRVSQRSRGICTDLEQCHAGHHCAESSNRIRPDTDRTTSSLNRDWATDARAEQLCGSSREHDHRFIDADWISTCPYHAPETRAVAVGTTHDEL